MLLSSGNLVDLSDVLNAHFADNLVVAKDSRLCHEVLHGLYGATVRRFCTLGTIFA